MDGGCHRTAPIVPPRHLSFNEILPERYQNRINDAQQSLSMLSLMPSVESGTLLSACHSTLRSPPSLSLTCLNTQTIFKGGYLTHHQNTQSFNQTMHDDAPPFCVPIDIISLLYVDDAPIVIPSDIGLVGESEKRFLALLLSRDRKEAHIRVHQRRTVISRGQSISS